MRKKVEKITAMLKNLSDEVKEKYNAEIVGIFGSYVQGKQRKSSDLDILVQFLKGATLFDFVRLSDFLEERLKIKVDVVPVDTVRKEIKDRVLKEAVYL